jgi:hypothetical protein
MVEAGTRQEPDDGKGRMAKDFMSDAEQAECSDDKCGM